MSGENYWIPVGRCLADSGLDAANAFASDADEQQVSKHGGASPTVDDRRQTDRVTTPTGAASAAPCRTPRRANSQLMTSQRKPTTVAVIEYSYDAAVDTLYLCSIHNDLWT